MSIDFKSLFIRSDLIFQEEGEILYVVDPKAKKSFEIVDTFEQEIISLLKVFSADIVMQQYNHSPSKVYLLLKFLQDNSLLEDNQLKWQNKDATSSKLLFLFRKDIWNPSEFLQIVSPWFQFVGAPLFYTVFAVICIGFILVWKQFHLQFLTVGWPLIGGSWWLSFVVFVVVLGIILFIHELSHGVVLARYGRFVSVFGVSISYGIPAMYTDLSEILMLNSKKEKINVLLIGPVVQILIGMLAFIGWANCIDGLIVQQVLWLISFGAFLSVFLNLNPLLRLDGYYILQILLGVDDIRQQSLSVWRNLRQPTKHKLFYVLYIPLSMFYTLMILLFISQFYLQNTLFSYPAITIVVLVLLSLFVLSMKQLKQ